MISVLLLNSVTCIQIQHTVTALDYRIMKYIPDQGHCRSVVKTLSSMCGT
jgi:hypothetical protein